MPQLKQWEDGGGMEELHTNCAMPGTKGGSGTKGTCPARLWCPLCWLGTRAVLAQRAPPCPWSPGLLVPRPGMLLSSNPFSGVHLNWPVLALPTLC